MAANRNGNPLASHPSLKSQQDLVGHQVSTPTQHEGEFTPDINEGEPGVGGRAGLALPQPHTGAHREQRGAEPRTPSCGNKACKPALPLPLHVSAGLGKQSIHPRGAPCSRTVSARPRRGLNVHSPTPGRSRQKFRTEKYI